MDELDARADRASFLRSRGESASAALAPDGQSHVVVDSEGLGTVWPISPGSWERRACALAGRNLTREEWRRYLPGGAYAATCSGLPSVD